MYIWKKLLVIKGSFSSIILKSPGMGYNRGVKVCILEMHVIYLLQNSSVYIDIYCVLSGHYSNHRKEKLL